MPNHSEILANTVFVNEFDSDTDMATLTQISGWFENNIGQLNTLIFTKFSGSGEAGHPEQQFTPKLGLEESGIYKHLYLKHFYKKKARNVLKGIDSTVDFVSLRELLNFSLSFFKSTPKSISLTASAPIPAENASSPNSS